MWSLWSLILGWLLTVVTVVGNGLVIFLITTKRNLRTTTNWFVLSLAVADFGVGTFSSSYLVSGVYIDCSDHFKCILVSMGLFAVYASVTNVCTLALDRYLAIVKPLRYVTFMTKKRVALLIFAAWSVAFLVFISYLVFSFSASPRQDNEIVKKYAFIFPDFLTVSICIFLTFATVRIFLIARRHSRQNAVVVKQLKFNHTLHYKIPDTQEAAASKLVCIVVAVFVGCSLLNLYIKFCDYLGFCLANKRLPVFRALLFLTNAAVNPIAYAFFKEGMRKELKRLFHCTNGLVPCN